MGADLAYIMQTGPRLALMWLLLGQSTPFLELLSCLSVTIAMPLGGASLSKRRG